MAFADSVIAILWELSIDSAAVADPQMSDELRPLVEKAAERIGYAMLGASKDE
jgi:hypothetical protein